MTQDPDRVVPIDHLIKRAEQNKLTPREAHELDKALSHEPAPEGVFAPITLMGPGDIAPIAYVLHKWTSRCLACNTIATWSEVYALNHLRSRMDKTFVRHMVPIQRLEWHVPIRVHEPKQRETPFCSECLEATTDFVATLPTPPIPEAVLKSAPQEKPKTPTGRRPAGPATADDLLV